MNSPHRPGWSQRASKGGSCCTMGKRRSQRSPFMNPYRPSIATSEALAKPAKVEVRNVRSWNRRFYVLITLFLIGIVAKGFWPSYFGPMFGGPRVPRAWVMHLHGAVFTGWMLLLLLQVGLAATGRIAAHRRVGNWGIGYGVLVLVTGLIATFAAPIMHIRAGEWTVERAAGFLIKPIFDMVLFAGFFGGAIFYRSRPEIHKRLILAATVSLAFAAVARMKIASPVLFYLAWVSPMLVGIAYDLWARRRAHPAYLISVGVMTVAFLRIFLVESEAWLKIGRALL